MNLGKVVKAITDVFTIDCPCEGQCGCHLLNLLGTPCPDDCKNRAARFDGCHRCDCLKEKRNGDSQPARA